MKQVKKVPGQLIQLKNVEKVTATEWIETRSNHGWSTAESKGIVYMLVSGLYFDYGIAKASLIEPPTPTIERTASFWGWGFAALLVTGKKTLFTSILVGGNIPGPIV